MSIIKKERKGERKRKENREDILIVAQKRARY